MKAKRFHFIAFAMLATVLFTLSGCGGGSKSTPVTTSSVGSGGAASLSSGKVGALGLAAKAEVRGLVENLPYFGVVAGDTVPALTKGKYLLPEGVASITRSSMTAVREITSSFVNGDVAYVSATFTLSGTLTFLDSAGTTVSEKPITMTTYGDYVLEKGSAGSWSVIEDATENLSFYSGSSSVSIQEVKYEPAFAGPGDTQKMEVVLTSPSASELYVTGKVDALGLKAVLADDGTGADFTANDGVYTAQYTIPSTAAEGQYTGVLDIIDKTASFDLTSAEYTGQVLTQPVLVGGIQSVTLTSNATTVTAGDYVYFLAEGVLGSGTTIDLTNDVTWTSSDVNVGDVYGPGYFYGFSSGTTSVSAALGTLTSNSISVTVTGSVTGGGTGGTGTGAFGAPANVEAIPSADGEVTLYWDFVAEAVSYNIYMASQTGVTPTNYASLPDGMLHAADFPYYVHTGLTNGKTYYFIVTAVSVDGTESEASVEVSATPTSSGGGAVGGAVAYAGDGSVSVYWDAIPGATSYSVYMASQMGVSSANYSTLPAGNVVSGIVDIFYTFTGLTNGVTYYFVVVGTDGTNVTPDSLEVSATPTAVTGGGAAGTCGDTYCDAAAGETQLTCASDCGGSVIASCGNGTCESVNGEDATTCSVDCTGGGGTPPPTCGDTYCDAAIGETTITCAADCTGGGGTPPPTCGDTYCDAAIGETTITCAADCSGGGGLSAPTLASVAAGNGSATLNYSAVSGAATYNAYASTSPAVTKTIYTFSANCGATTSCTMSGLTNGTTYYFVVTAYNATSGESPESSPAVSATPSAGGLSAPTGVGAGAGDGQATVSYNTNGASSYIVYTSTSPTVSKTINNFSTNCGALASCTVTGLTNGTTYYFVVTAYDATLGESAESAVVSATPMGTLSAPTGVSPSAGNGNVSLIWNSVAGATSYNIYYATVAGVTAANYTGLPGGTAITGVVSTSQVISPLTNGTRYYFIVTAFDGTTESASSAEVSTTPAVPGPANLMATPGNGQVTLSWDAVGTAFEYHVYYATVSGVTKDNYTGLPGGATQIVYETLTTTITGLTNGTTYYFVVTAIDGTETGNSNEVSATPTAPPLSAPTGVMASMGAVSGEIDISWGMVTGAVSYTVYYSSTPGVSKSIYEGFVPGIASTSTTLTGLTPGATYYLVVTAYDGVTESVESMEVSANALAMAPPGAKGKIQYVVLRLGDAYQSVKQKVKELVSL